MDFKLTELVDDRMAGVGAALIPDDNVESFGQQVDHPAFALVAPVDSDDRGTSVHFFIHLSD